MHRLWKKCDTRFQLYEKVYIKKEFNDPSASGLEGGVIASSKLKDDSFEYLVVILSTEEQVLVPGNFIEPSGETLGKSYFYPEDDSIEEIVLPAPDIFITLFVEVSAAHIAHTIAQNIILKLKHFGTVEIKNIKEYYKIENYYEIVLYFYQEDHNIKIIHELCSTVGKKWKNYGLSFICNNKTGNYIEDSRIKWVNIETVSE